MVAASLAVPLWRQLDVEATGPDVAVVETYLAEQGYDPGDIDEFYSWDTGEAAKRWHLDHGGPSGTALGPQHLLWGLWPARVASLDAAVGDYLSPGQKFAALQSALPAMSGRFTPSDRASLADGMAVEWRVRDQDLVGAGVLTALASTPTVDPSGSKYYAAQITNPIGSPLPPEGASVEFRVVLKTAASVPAVPVAAVGQDSSGAPVIKIAASDGTTETRRVTTGVEDSGWVELTSGALSGQLVIVEFNAT